MAGPQRCHEQLALLFLWVGIRFSEALEKPYESSLVTIQVRGGSSQGQLKEPWKAKKEWYKDPFALFDENDEWIRDGSSSRSSRDKRQEDGMDYPMGSADLFPRTLPEPIFTKEKPPEQSSAGKGQNQMEKSNPPQAARKLEVRKLEQARLTSDETKPAMWSNIIRPIREIFANQDAAVVESNNSDSSVEPNDFAKALPFSLTVLRSQIGDFLSSVPTIPLLLTAYIAATLRGPALKKKTEQGDRQRVKPPLFQRFRPGRNGAAERDIRRLQEEIEIWRKKAEATELGKEYMESEYEKTKAQLKTAKSELSTLTSTTRHLEGRIREIEKVMNHAVLSERENARIEMVRVKDEMLRILEEEQQAMREELVRQAEEIRAMYEEA